MTRDGRFLFSFSSKSNIGLQWLPIYEKDARWVEEAPPEKPESPNQSASTSILQRLHRKQGNRRVVKPDSAPLPLDWVPRGVEAGDDPGAPWLLAEVKQQDRMVLGRWEPAL